MIHMKLYTESTYGIKSYAYKNYVCVSKFTKLPLLFLQKKYILLHVEITVLTVSLLVTGKLSVGNIELYVTMGYH